MTPLTLPPDHWTGKNLLAIGIPWLTPEAIRFLEDNLKPEHTVLELGAGGSTVFFSQRCASVVSWESDPVWRKSVAQQLVGATNAWITDNFKSLEGQYDWVLVDNAEGRAELCRQALARVKPGGRLILDNYSRYDLGFLGGWVKTTFDDPHWSGSGTLIARRRTNAEWPIYVISKDRFSCLYELHYRLRHDGLENLTILDNGSTQPELLDYYAAEKLTVIHCDPKGKPKNVLWDNALLTAEGFYLYTDCDVVPDYGCPRDWPTRLCQLLEKYPRAPKAGLGLRIDNLPAHYGLRERVIAWENRWWQKKVEDGVYEAEIDTTMALYRPGTKYHCNALRTAGEYIARHLPWYYVSAHPTREHEYYLDHLHPLVGHWSRFERQERDKKGIAEKLIQA